MFTSIVAAIRRRKVAVGDAEKLVANFGSRADLIPLGDVLATSALPYAPTRCAGLYQALLEWAGEVRLGADSYAALDQARLSLISLAALAVRESGGTGSAEHIIEIVVRDTRNIADLYLSRFEANYAAQGEAFGTDDDLKNDLVLCKEIAELAGRETVGN